MDSERLGGDPVDTEPVEADEVDQLRRERDELAARLAALDAKTATRGRRVWRVIVTSLLVIGTLSFTLSAAGWWARRNVADTDVWVERVGPLADDPAVRAALGAWLSDEIVELIDPADLFVEVLPERGRLLATPLAGAVEDFVRERVDRFLASDRFERLWVDANQVAHRAVVRVLRGESEAVQAHGETVVINLVPVITAALDELGSASPQLVGREVDLPELTVDDVPDAAIQRLEQALGIELGEDYGQFVVYDHGRLTALQDGLDQARRGLYVLSGITILALGGALWLSDRRRRTLLQGLAGLAVGLLVIRRLGLRGRREMLAAIPDGLNRDAAEAASDQFLDPLLSVTQTLLTGLVVLALAVVLTGPYPWVVRLRHRTVELVRTTGHTLRRAGATVESDPAVGTWLRAHRSQLQLGGLAIVVALLLVLDLSFVGLAALGLLTALGGMLLHQIPAPTDAG